MIRFVDIRGQGTGYRFSYFNTQTNIYISFAGNVVFDTFAEVEECYRPCFDFQESVLARLHSLTPEWAFIKDANDLLWKEEAVFPLDQFRFRHSIRYHLDIFDRDILYEDIASKTKESWRLAPQIGRKTVNRMEELLREKGMNFATS